jgi:protein TonB
MIARELHDWIPSFLAVALAHGAVWHGFTHHRSVDEGPQILPVVQVSLVEFLPPRNRVTALQEKMLPPKKEPAPAPVPETLPVTTEPVVENPIATTQQAAPAPQEHSEPIYSAAYLNNQPPAYPLSARRRGIEGTVLLRVEIHALGHCQHVQVKRSSGHEVLDRAALEAVRQWRFVPARRGSQPVTAPVEVPITFKLDS